MLLNATISNMILIRSLSNSPALHLSSTTMFSLRNSKFNHFFSPLIMGSPSLLKVNSCLFSHFLATPFQIRKEGIDFDPTLNTSFILSNEQITGKSIQIISSPKVFISETAFVNISVITGKSIKDSTGGAIFILGAVQVILMQCTFQNCIAINAGAVNLCNSKSNISQCLFDECKSFDNVGALWSMGSNKNDSECNLTITETNFTRNYAGKNCGALNVNMSNAKIFSCIFDNNIANCSVGGAAFIGEFSTYLEFIEFVNNSCKNDCAALWLQGNLEYMNNIHKILLDTIHFSNNIINTVIDESASEGESNGLNEKEKSAIHTFGIVSLYFKNEICFDGEYDKFLINHHEEQFTIQQNFRDILFNNNSECFFNLKTQIPVTCPEFTNPYIENTFIKGKIPLYMPIQF